MFKKLFFSKSNNKGLVPVQNNLATSKFIPEPTRSLLFITDEDVSKVESATSFGISISISDSEISAVSGRSTNLNAEPSMIWTQLTVRENGDLEEKPMYYPAYTTLTPEQRYQYLMWLRDVTQPTNLSYVFLYYYGLERHLLLGDFEKAADEIFRLLKQHDRGTFRSYSETALLTASFYRKKFDYLLKQDFVFQNISDELLMVRKALGISVTATELTEISSWLGFRNRNYINKARDEFESALESILYKYEEEFGSILNSVKEEELEYYDTNCFANISIPADVRGVRIPNFIKNEVFSKIACTLLQEAHDTVKERKQQKRVKNKK